MCREEQKMGEESVVWAIRPYKKSEPYANFAYGAKKKKTGAELKVPSGFS